MSANNLSAGEMCSSRRSRITHSVLAEKPVSFADITAQRRQNSTMRPGESCQDELEVDVRRSWDNEQLVFG